MDDPVLSGDPYSKERQLARGTRRYRRKVASPKQWQAIIAAKQGPCRVCVKPENNGGESRQSRDFGIIEFMHLVSRSRGGDDVADNIVPGHSVCHKLVDSGDEDAIRKLYESLTPAERAYMVTKLGEALK